MHTSYQMRQVMTPSGSQQPNRIGREYLSVINNSRHLCPTIFPGNSQASTTTYGDIPDTKPEVVFEFATPGARAPIHFIEESEASSSWHSRPAGIRRAREQPPWAPPPAIVSQQASTPPMVAKNVSSCSYKSTTAPPIDGVGLTLLGLSTVLKTPDVDHWAVAKALVESSVDLRTRNVRGMTPLHVACSAAQVCRQKTLNRDNNHGWQVQL